MTTHDFDPSRIDVAAFAKDTAELSGAWLIATFDRLADATAAERPLSDADVVRWTARGERRTSRGGEPQVWLHLGAAGRLALVCQRCLKPVEVGVQLDCSILFVATEEIAAQLDSDSEHDVLALTRALDLHQLVEDELLLSLPLVPRHDVCPEPLELPADVTEIDETEPNPFAALAALKRGGPVN